ncbi:hypothetical protein EPUS_07479 [Endocarpon pusillum Z07020]|uniref:Uncharacterized protein n=1 Tax=Endocarpon pusillum (strain Z07020 / HMAS-L-300199) TaxID=1263415 RepID=U1GLD8_ENDPU|nr:uncharacterized protein EPUS_07479 [Endocarpon pusillum Z07020]ERF72686.1 hypothetical protein EPUS_07479 [Endocarpon pusillum Z07020]
MPPHLHPRSSATTTLFASTLAASFIIVGIPHIFPCPAPRKGYLDEDGKVVGKRRRRRGSDGAAGVANTQAYDADTGPENAQIGLDGELKSLLGTVQLRGKSSSVGRPSIKGDAIAGEEEEEDDNDDMRALFRGMKKEEAAMELRSRECPVPKPRGKIGELLGFGRDGRRQRVEDEDSGQRVR